MLAMLVLTAASAGTTPYVGAALRPLGRGDVAWVLEGRTTGLVVGGLDGFVRPPLTSYAGAWLGERVGMQGSVGVARLQNTTVADEILTQRHWGVVRTGIDARFAFIDVSTPRTPIPWVFVGTHVDIPSARDVSAGYSDEEVAAADQAATVDRSRLGAFGARVGIGVDYRVWPGVALGLQTGLQWQRSLFIADDPLSVTSWLAGDTALLLQFEWPGPQSEGEPAATQRP
jgi:hypothetical protein